MTAPRSVHPARRPCGAAALALSVLLLGCGRHEAPEAGQQAPKGPPSLPVVTAEAGDYVLRYFSPASGQLIVVHKRSEIPEGARRQVIVVPDDAKLRGPWLFVADLSHEDAGRYEVRVVDRFELERRVASARPQAPVAPAPSPSGAGKDVVLFRTSWCGYCEKAAEYLRLKGVPFVEKDLERDPRARREMLDRAARAGVPASSLQGVPIIAIGGRILTGFNRGAIDAALAAP